MLKTCASPNLAAKFSMVSLDAKKGADMSRIMRTPQKELQKWAVWDSEDAEYTFRCCCQILG